VVIHTLTIIQPLKGNSGSCCDMDEPGRRYAKGKKLDAKGQILYHSNYMKYPEYAHPPS
jgi:hypothetical protein